MIKLIFENIRPITKQQGKKISTSYGYVRSYLTHSYRDFIGLVKNLAKLQMLEQSQEIIKQNISVSAYLYWPEKSGKCPDLADNAFSGIWDSLEGVVYENDKQITTAYYKKIIVPKEKKIKIEITIS